MVYFPERHKTATVDATTTAAVWTERIERRDREMPVLYVTLPQASRLWGWQLPQSRALLGAGAERDRLGEPPDGRYGLVGALRPAHRGRGEQSCAFSFA